MVDEMTYEIPELVEIGKADTLTRGGGETTEPDACDCTKDRVDIEHF